MNGCISGADDNIDIGFNKFRRNEWKLLAPGSEPASINRKILAFDEAKPSYLVEQCDDVRRVSLTARQVADTIAAPGLLRPCTKRPSRRAADKRDEFAPVHSITS